jgi:hypothetical protein
METAECEQAERVWPAMYAADEAKLVDQINLARTTSNLCQRFVPVAKLEVDPRFECVARLRIQDDDAPRPSSGRATTFAMFYNPDPRDPKNGDPAGIGDRGRRAGLNNRDARVLAEIVIQNATSVNGIFDALKADPSALSTFCAVVTNYVFSVVGVGRSGSVWVVDIGFPGSTVPTTHPTNSGMGLSGPANSGTGGR